MKINRSLSIIDEDEPKYDYNPENDPENDEPKYTIISPLIMSSITILVELVYESYNKFLKYLKGCDDIDKQV